MAVKLRISPISPHALPDECKKGLGNGCGTRFGNSTKDLFQTTDGGVYCHKCGLFHGIYPLGTIPFKRRDDNIIPQ
jgi:hypothetical protein